MASRTNQQATGAYLKVVLIGEPGVGKTALLDSYSNKKISRSQQPTIGADFVKKRATLSDGETQVSLQLWDTAGQERFQSLCVTFYRGADCCVLVYDVSRRESYDRIAKWKHAFQSATNDPDIPFVIIGNKLDVGSRINPHTVHSEWIDPMEANFAIQASALTNQNVDDAFMQVAELAYEHHTKVAADVLKANQMGQAVNLHAVRSNFKLTASSEQEQQNSQSSKSKGCCGGGGSSSGS